MPELPPSEILLIEIKLLQQRIEEKDRHIRNITWLNHDLELKILELYKQIQETKRRNDV